MPQEFELIARYFAPLAASAPDALGLRDDVARLRPPAGENWIVTKDALTEGVHFLASDPPDLVARKLFRVNLSDIAAKGAVARHYLLALFWPRGRAVAGIGSFAAGLAMDQAEFGATLLGGDSVAIRGPFSASLTLFGACLRPEGPVTRAGARVGDLLYVTGTIGDAFLGLQIARGEADGFSRDDADYLLARYQLPLPRAAFASAIARWAKASLDISDGLLQDCGHLARESGLGAEIHAEWLPLSAAAASFVARAPDRSAALAALASGGDDYEIAFAAPREAEPSLIEAARAAGITITRIGRCVLGAGLRFIDRDGKEITSLNPGFQHF